MTLGGEVEIGRAAFGVEAGGNRYGLDKRRLTTAVLTHEYRHVRIEVERTNAPKGWKVEGIRAPIGIATLDLDATNKSLGDRPLRHDRSIYLVDGVSRWTKSFSTQRGDCLAASVESWKCQMLPTEVEHRWGQLSVRPTRRRASNLVRRD